MLEVEHQKSDVIHFADNFPRSDNGNRQSGTQSRLKHYRDYGSAQHPKGHQEEITTNQNILDGAS